MTSSGRLRWAGQGQVLQEEGPGLVPRSGEPLPPVSFLEKETQSRAQGLSLVPFLLKNNGGPGGLSNPDTGPQYVQKRFPGAMRVLRGDMPS